LKVVRLSITNFRGIQSAVFHFDGHALLVGANNVGKSTICEALDLALGPDRLNRYPAVEEFDFYNGRYLDPPAKQGGDPQPVPLKIEVLLVDLSPEVQKRCGQHIEFWNVQEKRILGVGEAAAANPPLVVACLRIQTVGRYDPIEDEFVTESCFSHSPAGIDGELTVVRRDIKRLFGFLYLRALRTGSRALSLERGSLLDVLLRLQNVRTGLWEKAIERLRDLDIEKDAAELEPVLTSIEERLGSYIPSGATGRATKLHVSQLTREHLRKTMSFFLAMRSDQVAVPFQQAGTGTLNTLVLALLSFIAELKPDSVIFAMEEPEIAVPPHTQRRIADYLLQKTTQAFVTSHSPYVIERFSPQNTFLLSRAQQGDVEVTRIGDATGLKENEYKRYARRGLSECMLGKGVIIVEGLTEFHALPVLARMMEAVQPNFVPLDIAGVALFDAESDGNVPKFAKFFRALGLKTFGFYDFKTRTPVDKLKFTSVLDIDCEHPYKGFEAMLAEEVPVNRLWAFLSELYAEGVDPSYGIPATPPQTEAEVRKLSKNVLSSSKGAGWAARLLESCHTSEFPKTAVDFLVAVYAQFPPPPPKVPAIPPVGRHSPPVPPPPPPPPPPNSTATGGGTTP
jgi:putative ATP-dependent endonuclease of OLD family